MLLKKVFLVAFDHRHLGSCLVQTVRDPKAWAFRVRWDRDARQEGRFDRVVHVLRPYYFRVTAVRQVHRAVDIFTDAERAVLLEIVAEFKVAVVDHHGGPQVLGVGAGNERPHPAQGRRKDHSK